MIKILLVHNYYKHAGGEDVVLDSEKKLLESMGHEVIVYARYNRETEKYNFLQKILFFARSFFSTETYKYVRALIETHRPSLAHVHNIFPLISPSIYLCLKKYNVPVIQTIHNYRFLCPNGLFLKEDLNCERCKKGNYLHCIFNRCYKKNIILSLWYSFILFFYRKIIHKSIDIFLSVSEFNKRKLIEGGIQENKIRVLSHFIYFDKYGEYKESKKNYAVYMGRLSREKGLKVLLEAFSEIKDLNLKIAGEGPMAQEIREFITKNKMNNVEMVGFKSGPQKAELLGQASFSIVPSVWYEIFSLATLESFASYTPVIASRIGSLPEIIEDGKNGLLFEPGNAKDLRDKIGRLSRHPEEAHVMGRYARRCVQEKYSPEQHYGQLIAIYSEALKGRG